MTEAPAAANATYPSAAPSPDGSQQEFLQPAEQDQHVVV
jgi:hypothetical protein